VKYIAEIKFGLGPLDGGVLTGIFMQGFVKGCDGLLEPRRPALPLAESPKRFSEIQLGCRPVQWRACAGKFPQGFAKGRDSFL
jgi:hypothetical protein